MEGVDETIAPLIDAMNQVSYLVTLSCCGGHPEESAVKEYGYAMATVVFDIEDEPENAIRWYNTVQDILRRRKGQLLSREHAFIFEKKFILNEDGYLSWQWELKIQATGKTPNECGAGLDEGIAFLTEYFQNIPQGTWK
jgi:hypothetical protein